MEVHTIALDLDGTLTQHRSLLGDGNRRVLDRLGAKYHLVMVGAGSCERIFRQMGQYPMDIIGNYGMEISRYDTTMGKLEILESKKTETDRQSVTKRVETLRERFGFQAYTGDTVEFFPSGMVCIPLIGTKADINDKLVFDPDRKKRRAIYDEVKALFPEYVVFVGGSSSFDMVPVPYDKYYALSRYCERQGLEHGQVVYFGDDVGYGGGDYSLFHSDFPFVLVDDYRNFPRFAGEYL